MNTNYEYMQDSDFLFKIDCLQTRTQYVKIIILDWNERPIQEIQGMTTSGSINLDGKSAMRRTCNLSMFVPNENLSNITNINNLFSLNKKAYLEIGIKNTTNQYTQYPIIWMPLGTFIIINPSLSHNASGVTMSLQLKDKMCLLNGECGGVIPASTQFDEYDTIDENGQYAVERPVIVQIIKEAVNHFGGEQLSKIILSDLDTRIKQVMKWIGSTPLYFLDQPGEYKFTTNYNEVKGKSYRTYEYGNDIGFIYTDFTYPGELIENAGSNVVALLDKIKNMLGNYEYFYDIYGNFVWQEIKNYLNTTHATVELNKLNNNSYIVDMSKGKKVFDFQDSRLITSYSNNPAFNKIKNDFVVWGIRKTVLGNTIPIRYHLAIDKKPKTGNIHEIFMWTDPDDGITKAKSPKRFNSYSDFSDLQLDATAFYLAEDSGVIYEWTDNGFVALDNPMIKVKANDWRTELYLQGVEAEALGLKSNYYYTELASEWPKHYDIIKTTNETDVAGNPIYTGDFRDEYIKDPSSMDYYLDFIDSDSAIGFFDIKNIGRRTHVVNSNDINCIFESDIPDFILIESGSADVQQRIEECNARGQDYILVDPAVYGMLATGGSQRSAFVEIKDLLYEMTAYNESVSISTLPIYHLEPNTRIGIKDPDIDISGDYMINSISLPLDNNGTSSISAVRPITKM